MVCRLFLIVKSAAYVTYAISLDDTTSVLLIFMLVISALIVVIVQPFKEEYNIFNMLSTNVLLVMALICASVAHYDASPVKRYGSFIIIGPFVLALLPLIYIMGVVIHHFYKRFCYTRFNKAFGTVVVSSLPHRILQSDQYQNTCGFTTVAQSSHGNITDNQ